MRLLAAILVVILCGCPSPAPGPAPTPAPIPAPLPVPPNPVPSPGPIPAPVPSPTDFSATAKALLIAHNNERAKVGVAPLTLDWQVNSAAINHTGWMVANRQFDHSGANGSSPSDRLKVEGYRPKMAGENIAMGQSNVAAVMSAWVKSPGHRRNLLNPTYEHCGFGMVDDFQGRKWWCAVFASPKLSAGDPEVFGSDSLPPGIVAEGIEVNE